MNTTSGSVRAKERHGVGVVMESWWLKCTVSQGMLPGEFVVVTSTSDGQKFSLFAPANDVNPKDGLIRVSILQRGDDAALVWLPANPIEFTSRTVKVSAKELVAR